MPEHFSDVLNEFADREGRTSAQLARLTGISRKTLTSWLDGRTKSPRDWKEIVRVAIALHLNEAETDRLLLAAEHPKTSTLLRRAKEISDGDGAELLGHVINNAVPSPDVLPPPFQVPPRISNFVGRLQLQAEVKEQLLAGGQICVLHGMGGVGKTALAQHLAYECQPDFADGVLYADLAGSNTVGDQIDEAFLKPIIGTFTAPYGRSLSDKFDLESRSRILREVLANKNVLIVLDNAHNAEDVTPLLPPTINQCAVLITTRNQRLLRSRAHSFTVEPFDADEGLELLRHFIKDAPIIWDQVVATQIIELLGGLPLAIKIVGSDLADAAAYTLREYRELLLDEQLRLDYLTDSEVDSKGVRTSLGLSYGRLQPEEQRLFISLSAFPVTEFSVGSVVSVSDLPSATTKKLLGRLRILSLIDIEETTKPIGATDSIVAKGNNLRCRLHPLLHAYALEKATTYGNQIENLREKVAAYFVRFAEENRRVYHLLDVEWENLVGILDRLHQQQDWDLLYRAVDCLTESRLGTAGFLDARGYWSEAVNFLKVLLAAPFVTGHNVAKARLHLALGTITHRLSELVEADAALREVAAILDGLEATPEHNLLLAQSEELLAQIAFSQGKAEEAFVFVDKGLARLAQTPTISAEHEMGYLHIRRGTMLAQIGQLAAALPVIQQGISLLPATPTPAKISGLMTLGTILALQGQSDKALACWQEGVEIARELGDSRRLAGLWQNIGALYTQTGNIPQAVAPKLEALAVYERIGDVHGVALMHSNLGDDYILRREYETAWRHLDNALASSLTHQLPRVELYTRVNLARYYLEQDDLVLAEAMLHQAELLSQRQSAAEQKAEVILLRAEWLLRRDQLEAALAQVEQALALTDVPKEQGVSWRLKGVVLAALAQSEQAESAFQESLSLLAHNPFEMARTRLSMAKWQGQLGRETEAQVLLQAADTVFRELNLPAYWQETAPYIKETERPMTATTKTAHFTAKTATAPVPIQTSFTVVTLSDTVLPGRTLEILQDTLLATGGQGEVYLGRERLSGQAVVIKRLKAELVRDRPEAVRRLQQEARLLHYLNHPNIVKLLADQQGEEGYALVMEYIPGGSLRDLLRLQPRLPLKQALDVALELADALARTHHLGVVHRDLKPDNVLIAADGTPRLTDFGIARLMQQEIRLTGEGAVVGTIPYMSPEAFDSKPVDARTDIWSFGILLFEMLTGELPFAGDGLIQAILREPPPDLLALRPETPVAVAELIAQMLVKDKVARLASMRHIAALIETIRGSL